MRLRDTVATTRRREASTLGGGVGPPLGCEVPEAR